MNKKEEMLSPFSVSINFPWVHEGNYVLPVYINKKQDNLFIWIEVPFDVYNHPDSIDDSDFYSKVISDVVCLEKSLVEEHINIFEYDINRHILEAYNYKSAEYEDE